jgi:hypothetical protein
MRDGEYWVPIGHLLYPRACASHHLQPLLTAATLRATLS